jgi:hypothetical protein
MRVLSGLALISLPLAALAQDGWTALSGEAIRAALTDRTLQYSNAWQDFRASGRTLYNAGSDSWGYWRIEGDQYCSQWPPSDLWACYVLEQKGERLRFVGQGDDITEADYVR